MNLKVPPHNLETEQAILGATVKWCKDCPEFGRKCDEMEGETIMAYFSNSTDGFILDDQCCDCIIPDDAPCPVLLAQQWFNYSQHDNPQLEKCLNMLVNKDGICKMKVVLDKMKGEHPATHGIMTKEQIRGWR